MASSQKKPHKLVTVSEMRALDQNAIEEYGIPGLILMENAGRGSADIIAKTYAQKRILVLCGKGNNGGDGFVIARHLINRGFRVKVLLVADPDSLTGDAALNYRILEKMQADIHVMGECLDEAGVSKAIKETDVLIDSLLGSGLKDTPRKPYASLIRLMNESGKKIVAVDIPSGLDADNGQPLGEAVRAEMTVTMGFAKKGLVAGQGPSFAGQIHVVDISLPGKLTD